MIYQYTHELVLAGLKTETRRLQMPGDITDRQLARDASEWPDLRHVRIPPIGMVVYTSAASGKLRVKYQVGKTYAVQPGRGQRAVGRILLMGIRSERVQDITEDGAIAEGISRHCSPPFYFTGWTHPNDSTYYPTPTFAYAALWDTIHKTPGTRFDENPMVWVLTFELVEEA